ncbi:hypothetical protein SAMN04488024_110109 [Pedobacter soli]|uniref:Uncharacterized protein n=1 Tax=Pedobacter soli TaxID=390242 RepID=A0A1G6ZHG8_9SPHI|nr:hypothetical protein SAMN04488024_110109 [Pedobacter soli]
MEKHQAFYFYVLNNTNRTANTFSYTYDSLNRLTNAAAGNRVTVEIPLILHSFKFYSDKPRSVKIRMCLQIL